ncbi:hypothetical protein HPP92_025922 [Vanilla planifolia]|uniref:VQ domain-containing protein n=1 Tax=Vanilla planifolia TaxID=51239 RepID=A0A835U709_VANPL|nr:hypothetical protein HPP92_025922 [Vanilla planifolia]KAG0469462.1 hypothetical protein HPP92_016162 [Vanilla planifolia]
MDTGFFQPPGPHQSLSPRREVQLQGPRPSPLRVSRDSHKIKKPPVPPAATAQPAPQPPPREPVIIYTVSPKIIHVEPANFMDLVQRLTGSGNNDLSTPSSFAAPGVLSPAAKLATIQRSIQSPASDRPMPSSSSGGIDVLDDIDMEDRPMVIPGILSPVPALLLRSLQPSSRPRLSILASSTFARPEPCSSFFKPAGPLPPFKFLPPPQQLQPAAAISSRVPVRR